MDSEQHSLLSRALSACGVVAKKIGATKETKEMMVTATRAAPLKALICYQAIINSYKEKKNG